MQLSLFFVALCLLLAVSAVRQYVPVPSQSSEDQAVITPEFISHVSSLATWTAGPNTGSTVDGLTYKQAKKLMGVKRNGFKLPEQTEFKYTTLPTNFSSMANWPNCPSIGTILDQSACGSCWAFGAAEAMSDRTCIHLKVNVSLSEDDLTACCSACGDGCGGGDPGTAWDYYVKQGLVTNQCMPYPFPSCDHHLPNSTHPCPSNEYPNPVCKKQCKDGETWQNAIHKGSKAYSITSGKAVDIQTEIFNNGPVETAFTVYADFLLYTGGIYKHKTGAVLGGHAVKFVGWGTESDGDYWLVANSWNPDWGLNGFFKIARGVNECGIESEVWGGVPKN